MQNQLKSILSEAKDRLEQAASMKDTEEIRGSVPKF